MPCFMINAHLRKNRQEWIFILGRYYAINIHSFIIHSTHSLFVYSFIILKDLALHSFFLFSSCFFLSSSLSFFLAFFPFFFLPFFLDFSFFIPFCCHPSTHSFVRLLVRLDRLYFGPFSFAWIRDVKGSRYFNKFTNPYLFWGFCRYIVVINHLC